MRRLAALPILLALTALSACSTPRFSLTPRFSAGEVREYLLATEATTRIDVTGLNRSERTRLEALARIEVLAADPAGTRLRVTLEPRRFERDGAAVSLPAPQEAEVILAPDGSARQISGLGVAPDVESVVPLLGSSFPPGRVRLGARWRSPTPQAPPAAAAAQPTDTAETRGRLAAVRVVDGYRCAIVSLSVTRPLTRERAVGGTTLRLTGSEVAAAEISFAFEQGFPVHIESDGEATLRVEAGSGTAGSVVIRSRTTLDIRRRTAPTAPARTPDTAQG